MVQSQFSLSWDSYKSSVCSGFSALQQNGEFVDMTLAADGHHVKVHQVLVALSSPYLKDLITSAPCQHPIIFLNNVSHSTLCYLLEYIYTGEVLVPAENLTSFADTARALHIKGLENINGNNHAVKMAINVPPMDGSELSSISGVKRKATQSSEEIGQMGLPSRARKIFLKHKNSPHISMKQTLGVTKEERHGYNTDMDDAGVHDSDDEFKPDNTSFTGNENDTSIDKINPSSNLQFTVSIRGSLQVILNRYIYNLHSTTTRTGVRRWRCVDYRNNKCLAFVVTKGNIVLNRANLHNHSFHDKKIIAKIEKKAVYSALADVEGYKEKADKDESMENENFMLLEDFSDDMEEK